MVSLKITQFVLTPPRGVIDAVSDVWYHICNTDEDSVNTVSVLFDDLYFG